MMMELMNMNNKIGIKTWFGKPIDPYSDPWYRFDRILSLLERSRVAVPDGSRWLDLGCQIGQFLKLLQTKYQLSPTGIDDFDENNVVEVCRRHMRLEIKSAGEVLDPSWRYLSRRIERTGFDIKEKFSFISALEIIEHMIDTDAFINECRNHLENNGYLVVSTPNINSLRNRLAVPLGLYPSGMEYRTINHHVRLYNVATLKSHVEEYGFRLVAMSGVNFLPMRLLRGGLLRRIDGLLSSRFPSLCGGIIAIFTLVPVAPGLAEDYSTHRSPESLDDAAVTVA
jgi:2-polyprenyl-3-methyl-5-hydroxy-6-metoxy-1,4-benzoquinol methylase